MMEMDKCLQTFQHFATKTCSGIQRGKEIIYAKENFSFQLKKSGKGHHDKSRFYQTFHPVLKSCQPLSANFSSSLKVLPAFARKLFIQSQSLAILCQQTFHPVLKSYQPLPASFSFSLKSLAGLGNGCLSLFILHSIYLQSLILKLGFVEKIAWEAQSYF